MRELSIESAEAIDGGAMSFNCGLALTALGLGAIAVGSVTGGIGFFSVLSMVELGVSTVGFMNACGPKDFR